MAIIIKGNVQGDVISDGGVKNETHHHYGAEHRVETREMQETHVKKTPQSVTNVLSITLSASRQSILDQLLNLADKGEWAKGVTDDELKAMLKAVLGQSETPLTGNESNLSEALWQLLENGRGERVKIVWQNLIGYFVDRKLLPSTIGAPAMNKMFFGDDKGYTNIDKGRPSKGLMTAEFESLLPLLDAYVPKVG